MEIINAILLAIATSVASSIGTWIVSRKKNKAETLDVINDTYNHIINSLRDQLVKSEDTIKKLTEKIDELEKKIDTLQEEIKQYQNEND